MNPSRWPMILTLSRIVAAPIVAGLTLWASAATLTAGPAISAQIYTVAAIIFILAALTDFLDGWLARKLNAVTPLGAALDHVADKALITAAFVALAYALLSAELVAAVVLLLVRDVCVAGLREGLSAQGRSIPVSQFGKYKAGAEMVAAPAILFIPVAAANPPLRDMLDWIAQIALWAAVALAYLSAALYIRAAFAIPPRS